MYVTYTLVERLNSSTRLRIIESDCQHVFIKWTMGNLRDILIIIIMRCSEVLLLQFDPTVGQQNLDQASSTKIVSANGSRPYSIPAVRIVSPTNCQVLTQFCRHSLSVVRVPKAGMLVVGNTENAHSETSQQLYLVPGQLDSGFLEPFWRMLILCSDGVLSVCWDSYRFSCKTNR